jgi:hypothetical protein
MFDLINGFWSFQETWEKIRRLSSEKRSCGLFGIGASGGL